MHVLLRNPRRELEVSGIRTVGALLAHLDIDGEGVLVIVNGELVPSGGRLSADDEIEIRPVISGGA